MGIRTLLIMGFLIMQSMSSLAMNHQQPLPVSSIPDDPSKDRDLYPSLQCEHDDYILFDTTLEESQNDQSNNGLGRDVYPWSMQCHDTRHTSLSPYTTPNAPLAEVWQYPCSMLDSGAGPVIDNQGIIYFGDYANNLCAVYPNGTKKWTVKFEPWDPIFSTPALAPDGTIYVASYNDFLYAVTQNGTKKWGFDSGASISTSPVIATDGTIYFGNYDGTIYAINPDGTKKWQYETGAGSVITSDPALTSDGTLIIGSQNSYIFALYPNGTLRWKYKTDGYVVGSSSVAADGTIYSHSYDGYLYAFTPDGTVKWKTGFSGANNNPSIGPDGTIYCGCYELYAFAPNGSLKWRFDPGPSRLIHWSSPAISADGKIYVGTEINQIDGGELIVINPDGTEHWRSAIIADDSIDSSPAIAPDGTVYIGSKHESISYLHAFGIGPFYCDAGGPYHASAYQNIQFMVNAFGGIPPYTFLWDFGDGNTSTPQNPVHNYTLLGNYSVTVTAWDSGGNVSSDSTYAVIDSYLPPTVEFTKPRMGWAYIFNIIEFNCPQPGLTLIIGPLTIEAAAWQEPFGIDYVEFYIDGKLKATDDTEPYQCRWTRPYFLDISHEIVVYAFDTMGNKSKRGWDVVWKLF